MDCATPKVAGKEFGEQIAKALTVGKLDEATSKNLNAVLDQAHESMKSCNGSQQGDIATATVAQLESAGILPKVLVTYAENHFGTLSESMGQGSFSITPRSLDNLVNREAWNSPPPPLEKQLFRYLHDHFKDYNKNSGTIDELTQDHLERKLGNWRYEIDHK